MNQIKRLLVVWGTCNVFQVLLSLVESLVWVLTGKVNENSVINVLQIAVFILQMVTCIFLATREEVWKKGAGVILLLLQIFPLAVMAINFLQGNMYKNMELNIHPVNELLNNANINTANLLGWIYGLLCISISYLLFSEYLHIVWMKYLAVAVIFVFCVLCILPDGVLEIYINDIGLSMKEYISGAIQIAGYVILCMTIKTQQRERNNER